MAPLHYLYPKPALGGVRPEAFGINEAPILNNAYAYPNYYLFLIGCFKTIAMKDEHEKKMHTKKSFKRIFMQIFCF